MQDLDFRIKVLTPRGILFPSKSLASNAFAHFGTSRPSDGSATYKDLEGCQHTEVWLTADEQFIRDVNREYTYMRYEGLCEAEFATYAKETLLRRDPRVLDPGEDREWRTERMVEFSAKPGPGALPGQWQGPPVTEKDSTWKEFDFDIHPDCQYWLSVRAFNPEYTRLFTDYVFVHGQRITCPYFTIEFKKDYKDNNNLKAQDQVATASAVALYNRCQLKRDRLIGTRKRWTQKHNTSLRYYGLTLAGPIYQFWWIRLRGYADGLSIPPEKWKWCGCEMVRASNGSLDKPSDVRNFVEWLNEIHRWGLTVHGPSCEKDVKFCISNTKDAVRTSLEEVAEQDSDTEIDEEQL